MSFLRQLISVLGSSESFTPPIGTSSQADIAHLSAKTALKFLLAVITIIFFLLTITLLQRSQVYDFQALSGKPWLPFNDLQLLWQNTGVLLLACICLALAGYLGKKKPALLFMCTAGALILSALFIAGQMTVWQFLQQAGFGINDNPANSYFFLLTGIHGVHIIGGLFALVRVTLLYYRSSNHQQLLFAVKLCALYWHYLLLIWLFLFFLLTQSARSFKAIALLCGFAAD